LYAASQTFDEARHVEVFNKYLQDKIGIHYPINPSLKLLLDKILTDERWDLKFIGMQIIIEGLALAAFQMLKSITKDPLLKQLLHYVVRDEARHVTFGINYLEDFIQTLTPEEINERAQFAYEACVISRERLINTKAEQRFLKMSEEEAREFQLNTKTFDMFRNFLFSRVIPNLSRIGLLTDEVRPKFEALGLLEYEHAPDDFECDWAEMRKPLEKFGQIPEAI
jgi:ribonucleotide reductase beta subunit family protein with ferritin-like domain